MPNESSRDVALREQFSSSRIAVLCDEYLEAGTEWNLRSLAAGRQFVVSYIPADSPFADIPRSVETSVFSETFELGFAEIVEDYGKYDPASVFATVIDVSGPQPVAAGALRITEYTEELSFKDVNDLVGESEDNPWLAEIKQHYFEPGESYDPMVAWNRLGERSFGRRLDLTESVDIATHASAASHRGKRGALDGVSMLFYHACIRYALATRRANLLAIFDLKPLANLQQFGNPFDVYHGLTPKPYGGPYDTLPAAGIIEEGMQRIRAFNAAVGHVFFDGVGLRDTALLPMEYDPERHSDEAIAAR